MSRAPSGVMSLRLPPPRTGRHTADGAPPPLSPPQVAIVMTYIQLSNEDYRWWWRSFLGPGTVGLYAFVYAVGYFLVYDMHMVGSFRSVALYIGYNFIIPLGLALIAGTVGFLATFYFIYRIFGAVKLD